MIIYILIVLLFQADKKLFISTLNICSINTKLTADMINIEIIFSKNPARTISLILILPLPKITALGGVAIGNIKAQLAAIVDGITKYKGF